MPYTNVGIVKRYKKKRKSRAKNPKKPYTETETVTIDLGNQSEFEHNQEVVIISSEDYANILEQLQQLEDQQQHDLEDAGVDPMQNNGNVNGHVTNEDLNMQLLNMDNAAIKMEKIQRELDYYKSMAIDWNGALIPINDKINLLIDEVIKATCQQYNALIDQHHEKTKRDIGRILQSIVDDATNNICEEYQQYNENIAANIDAVVEETNQEIRKTSTWKLIFNKNKVNLQVPTNDLMQSPPNIEKILVHDNAQLMEKLQSKPNVGQVDNMAIKQNLVNIPNLEKLAVKSNSKK